MTNLEWLLQGDPVVNRLTRKYLLNELVHDLSEGFIDQYLQRYDNETKTWGNGYYGPKWTSTNYTLLDLRYMEIDPQHPIYQESLINYLNHYFKKYIDKQGIAVMDQCITGMFVKLLSYGNIHDHRMQTMINYLLDVSMSDGGWNCLWNHSSLPTISSVHTTINVLEGLDEYVKRGYTYRTDEVTNAIHRAVDMLLSRQLLFIRNTQRPIHPSFLDHHFPPRWKYDYLRILEFLAQIKYPYHPNMQPALDVLVNHFKAGKLTKGTMISGRIHFQLENEKYGRFNTFRGYRVLKQYAPELFQRMMHETY